MAEAGPVFLIVGPPEITPVLAGSMSLRLDGAEITFESPDPDRWQMLRATLDTNLMPLVAPSRPVVLDVPGLTVSDAAILASTLALCGRPLTKVLWVRRDAQEQPEPAISYWRTRGLVVEVMTGDAAEVEERIWAALNKPPPRL